MSHRTSLVPLFLAALIGCDPAPPCAGVAAAEAEMCNTNHYFQRYDGLETPGCAPSAEPVRIGGAVRVALYRGGVSDARTADAGRRLQRYFAPYELSFTTGDVAEPVALEHAMSGTRESLEAAILEAGVPLAGALTPEQKERAARAVGRIVFADLRAFIEARAAEGGRRVDMIVLRSIVSPSLRELLGPGAIVGIGLSPALLRTLAMDDPQANLADMIGLPPDFAPVFAVGYEDTMRLAKYPDGVLAHEMGHALGLPHSSDPTNLMFHGGNVACRPHLEAEQAAALDGVERRDQALGRELDEGAVRVRALLGGLVDGLRR